MDKIVPKSMMIFEEIMAERQAEQFDEECIRKHQGKLVFGGITPDELMELYKKWDYKYKPKYLYFSRTFDELIKRGFDFQEYLEEMRIQAYYSHHHPETDSGFDQLACLIYLAMAKGMKTPYDHILNSDKDFEYKLNHLHKEE